ncbi:MAG: DUF6132 family protein [Bacteroidales bacterium]
MEENEKPASPVKKKFFLFFTLISAIGTMTGAIGGYLYYLKVGCSSGTCAITSSPWLSTIWGAAMGFLLGDLLSSSRKKDKSK